MIGIRLLQQYIGSSPIRNSIYKHINPVLTDVSLRDGIQGMSPNYMTLTRKVELFHNIYSHKLAQNIEVGSIVNTKLLPIMADVSSLYNYCGQYIDDSPDWDYQPRLHAVVPKLSYLETAVSQNMNNFAFLSSTSNEFQKANLNMTLSHTKYQLKDMNQYLIDNDVRGYKKLYISCVDTCPFRGKILNSDIAQEISEYSSWNFFDEICISDTCGKLTCANFRYIIDMCSQLNVNMDTISLHLHVSNRPTHIENIIRYALNKHIHRFDVSMLSQGGCNMTLTRKELHQNLSYELFYGILTRYIDDLAKSHINSVNNLKN